MKLIQVWNFSFTIFTFAIFISTFITIDANDELTAEFTFTIVFFSVLAHGATTDSDYL